MIIEDGPVNSPALGYEEDREIGLMETAIDAGRVVVNEDWFLSSELAESRYADYDNPKMVQNVFQGMTRNKLNRDVPVLQQLLQQHALTYMDADERHEYMTNTLGMDVDPLYTDEKMEQMKSDYADDRAKAAKSGDRHPFTAGAAAMGAFIMDPVNVAAGGASAALRAGKGLSLANRLMVAAGENALLESALQAQVYQHKQAIDSPYTSGDVFNNIALAGGGGAVFEGLTTLGRKALKSKALKNAGLAEDVKRDVDLMANEAAMMEADGKALDEGFTELDSIVRENEMSLPAGEGARAKVQELPEMTDMQLEAMEKVDPEIRKELQVADNRIASFDRLRECLLG